MVKEAEPQKPIPHGKHKEQNPLSNWVYDVFLWTFAILIDLFFREVHPRGAWKVPRQGPVIFVAAPHANQFVDPLILMRTLRNECKRRASFLIAAKSMNRFLIGWFARKVGAVPVGRALDMVKPGSGTIYLPDPIKDPFLVRGVGTKFESKEVQIGGLLVLPSVNGTAANAEIGEVISNEELRIKRPFKGQVALRQLTGRDDIDENGKFADENVKGTKEGFEGSKYKTAPKVDQTEVYDAVFDSHDRTELLPLKAGVAIMALGALAAQPNSVPQELVELYKTGDRREAIGRTLEIVTQSLVAVTVTSPDYDTLMLIQAVRRLYNPTGKKLPLPMVVELNRRLVKGYTHYKDDPRVVALKKSVIAYNNQVRYLNLRDHQVEHAKSSTLKALFLLFYRLGKISVLSIGVLPGLILFAPVFVATKIISIKKSKEALAASTVKLQGRDVMATWKLLVSIGFAPALYTFYVVLLTYWTHRNRIQAITFAALRFGEVGMDILKSLRPLLITLNPGSVNTVHKLRERRAKLSIEVTELINTLGPEMFPDFDSTRIITDPFKEDSSPISPRRNEFHRRGSEQSDTPSADASVGGGSSFHNHLPKNESFSNLANQQWWGFGSAGFPLRSFSTLDSSGSFDEVSQKIQGAMMREGSAEEKTKSAGSGARGPG
ncbi:hypothetical protein B0O99DRAFT_737227 [Bisporella sp. PMI_857]|nr:hypothetical protein B0O99DRAFT_737227 [Bisporella sp. PMI_857]